MHPNEIKLVFRGESGIFLPTRDFRSLSKDVKKSPAHLHALAVQVSRQEELIEKQ